MKGIHITMQYARKYFETAKQKLTKYKTVNFIDSIFVLNMLYFRE